MERVTPNIYSLSPDMWISGMREIHPVGTDTECRPHPGEHYPSSARCCHLFGAVTNYSSGHFIILSG